MNKALHSCLVISRADVLHDGSRMFFQNLDGPYIDGIAENFSSLTVTAGIHRKDIDASYKSFLGYTYQFKSKNIKIREIPEHKSLRPSLWSAFARIPRQFIIIYSEIQRHEIVFVMMSTYRAVFGAIIGKLLRKRVILYSGNDWPLDVDTTYRWRGLFGSLLFIPYKMLSGALEKIAMRAAEVRLLNGWSLIEKYKAYPGITIQTQPLINIDASKCYRRKDTCLGNLIKILCVANVIKRKGIEHLIKALHILAREGYAVDLTIVGKTTDSYAAEMLILREELKLQNMVFFTGYVENGPKLFKIYADSDIFVLPSYSEGFPRVLLEAMAYSLPLVVSDIPNIKNRLGEGAAVYAKPGDENGLAAAIGKICNDTKLRQDLIKSNFAYISGILEYSAIKQFKDVYEKNILNTPE